ncbi:MAG: SBBP repeat-containing protein [Rhodospirillaceae bacterium]
MPIGFAGLRLKVTASDYFGASVTSAAFNLTTLSPAGFPLGLGGGNITAIATDGSGNVYVTGNYRGTVDFDPGVGTANLTSNGGADVFIEKLDSSGAFVWVKSFGGSADDVGCGVAVDGSGNVYVTGAFWSEVDFDPGVGTANLTSNGVEDVFIEKLDSSGAYVWTKTFGAADLDRAEGIAVDNSGNVVVTGYFHDTVDFDPGAGTYSLSASVQDIFVEKLDSSGAFVWAKSFVGSTVGVGSGVAMDGSGNVYITGYFMNTVDFDPGAGIANLTTNAGTAVFIEKLDSSGNYVWAKAVGDTGVDSGNGIAVDGSGNVYATGSFTGTVDFDPGAGTANLTGNGVGSVFIEKLDSSGNYVWAKAVSGSSTNSGNGVAVDDSGNVYTTGSFSGAADFDPGAGTANLTSNGGTGVFIEKLDSSGNYVWAKGFGGSGNDAGTGIVVDGSRNVFVTGTITGSLDFDSGPGAATLSDSGFIARLDSSGVLLRHAPTDIGLSATSTDQRGGANSGITTLSATDADSGDTFTYALVTGTGDTDNARFSVSGTTLSLNGSFLGAGNYAIRLRVTDSAGLIFERTATITVTAPTLAITSDVSALKAGETANITFTFSTDPGLTFTWNGTTGDVVVSGGALGAISGSGLTRTATFTPTASLASGGASITVASGAYTDAAGNAGGAGTTPTISIDTLPPSAPTITGISPDTGSSSTDGVTRAQNLTFSGTAEAGSTVELYIGSTHIGTTTSNGSGRWQLDYTGTTISEGQYNVHATSTDAAGNTSVVSPVTTIVVETQAPTAISGSLAAVNASRVGFSVGTVSATDSAGQAMHYTLTNDGGHFAIDQTTGRVTISNAIDYSFSSATRYTITVQVENAAGLSSTRSFDVAIPLSPAPTPPPAPSSDSGGSSSSTTTPATPPTSTATQTVASPPAPRPTPAPTSAPVVADALFSILAATPTSSSRANKSDGGGGLSSTSSSSVSVGGTTTSVNSSDGRRSITVDSGGVGGSTAGAGGSGSHVVSISNMGGSGSASAGAAGSGNQVLTVGNMGGALGGGSLGGGASFSAFSSGSFSSSGGSGFSGAGTSNSPSGTGEGPRLSGERDQTRGQGADHNRNQAPEQQSRSRNQPPEHQNQARDQGLNRGQGLGTDRGTNRGGEPFTAPAPGGEPVPDTTTPAPNLGPRTFLFEEPVSHTGPLSFTKQLAAADRFKVGCAELAQVFLGESVSASDFQWAA